MAKITASVYTSHVPAIGAAMDLGKTQEDYWKPVFAGYDYCSPASAGDATCGALLGMPCDVATLPCEPNAVCVPIEGTAGICGVNQSETGCPQAMPQCWFPADLSGQAQCMVR